MANPRKRAAENVTGDFFVDYTCINCDACRQIAPNVFATERGHEASEGFEMGEAKYVLRFFCEWGAGCLWPGNEAAYQDFELGPYDLLEPCPLPLSVEVLRRCREVDEWHRGSLNWNYPPDPGPWRQLECDQFNAAVVDLLAAIRGELGPQFEVIDKLGELTEDPDLNSYLADPKGFRRKP